MASTIALNARNVDYIRHHITTNINTADNRRRPPSSAYTTSEHTENEHRAPFG